MLVSKKWFYIIMCLFFVHIHTSGIAQQDSLKDSLKVVIDSSKFATQNFSINLAEKYNGDEFNYDTAEGEAQNLLARVLNWFFKGLRNIFGVEISPWVSNLIENIIYIALIIGVIYLLIRILAGKDAVSFFRKKNNIVAPINITEEHIENIDLDQLINDALTEKDYRLAIRYMYLKALKDLSLRNLISYHFEKTNTDYYREIADVSLKQNFNRISYLYDYIWYGEFELDDLGYQNAKKSFDKLNTKMKSLG